MTKKEVITLVVILIVLAMPVYAIPSPEALYCKELGHEYHSIKEADSSEKGVCVVDGTQCDSWEFYKGRCRPDRSACAVNGYDTITVEGDADPASREYALCVQKGTGDMITGSAVATESKDNLIFRFIRWLASYMITGHAVAEPQGIPAVQLTSVPQKLAEYQPPARPEKATASVAGVVPLASGDTAPSSFDWRNHNGQNWVTSVKNQGSCGSCWAFSAVASMEAKKNIQHNNPDIDPDMAEDYLVSDCLTYNTCCGGWNDDAFQYVRDSGITDESCFPYVESCDCPSSCGSSCAHYTLIPFTCSDWTCSNRCGTWSSRLWDISSYTYYSAPSDSAIKQYLYDNGPLSVCLGIGSGYGGYWDGDIYRCSDDSGTNHCVLLVGYDDSGGYWIMKNSWGSGWNGDGYYKLGYGECHVSKIAYATNVFSNFPTISITSPSGGHVTDSDPAQFTFSANTVADATATCQLVVDGTAEDTNTSTDDAVTTALFADLEDGTHQWNISCWENSAGGYDASGTRTLTTDTTAPSLVLLSPNQDSIYPYAGVSLNYTVDDLTGVEACWFTNTTGQNQTLPGCDDYLMQGITDGNHTITVYANDSFGHLNSTTVDFAVDLNPPSVELEPPTPADLHSTTDVEFTFNATVGDNVSSITSCWLELEGSHDNMNMRGTGTNVTCDIHRSVAGSGTFSYKVYANDSIGRTGASDTRQLTIINTAPSITDSHPATASPTVSEPSDQLFNITYEDVNNDALTVTWYQNGTLMGNEDNFTFEGNYTSAGTYNITAEVTDGKDKSNQTWTLTVQNTNRKPEAQDVTLGSTDALNRTNGTLTGSWSYHDPDGEPEQDNETRWYNESLEIEELRNETIVLSSHTRRDQNWTFSVRVHDGIEWSGWQNSTGLLVQNLPPELDAILDIEVRETEWVNISVDATDEDDLIYAINDTRFAQSGNNFSWKTGLADSGEYTVRINVTDGQDTDRQDVEVLVKDAPDFDNDGDPDFTDTDDDNDGVGDATDRLTGNSSNIETTIPGVRLWVNDSEEVGREFDDDYDVNVTDQAGDPVIEFRWNFSQDTLTVNWTVNATNGTTRVSGLNLAAQGRTKTLYVNKSDSDDNYVCIADDEVTTTLPADCAGYTKVSCGSTGRCTDLGDRFRVTGLSHSVIRTVYVAPSQPPSGGGGGGGGGSYTSREIDIVPSEEGVIVGMGKNDDAVLYLGVEEYPLTVTSVGLADVMFTLNRYYYTIGSYGQKIDIDVDKDATRDITAELLGISRGEAKLKFSLYSPPQRDYELLPPAPPSRSEASAEEAEGVGKEEPVAAAPEPSLARETAVAEEPSPPPVEESTFPGMTSIIISIASLVMAVIVVLVLIIHHRRATGAQEKPEYPHMPPAPQKKPVKQETAARTGQAAVPEPQKPAPKPKQVQPRVPPKPAAKSPPRKEKTVHDLNQEIKNIKEKIRKTKL